MINGFKRIIGGAVAIGVFGFAIYLLVIFFLPADYNFSTEPAGEPFRMNPIISDASGTSFNIGDIGPAGGIIFFDRGYHADGWRYLEVSPAHLAFTAHWGGFVHYSSRSNSIDLGDVRGTSEGIGTGRSNTEIIIEHALNMRWSRARYSPPTPFEGAAQLVVEFDYNGFNDWFLPSKDELNLMYENLAQHGIGNFGSPLSQGTDFYWSSTQVRHDRAWVQNFETGQQRSDSPFSLKNREYRVRAIRAF